MRRALLTAAIGLVSASVLAQSARREARLDVLLPPAAQRAQQPPMVVSANMLTDRATMELLNSGFPARLHFRLELWEARPFFDHLISTVEWDVVVRYDPLGRHYTAARIADRVTPLGTFAAVNEAEDAVARPYPPALKPPIGHGKYYYFAELQVEMLSVGDIDEVERWLRGDLQPGLHGKEDPGTVLGHGLKTLVTRLLGGQTRAYRTRTSVFRP